MRKGKLILTNNGKTKVLSIMFTTPPQLNIPLKVHSDGSMSRSEDQDSWWDPLSFDSNDNLESLDLEYEVAYLCESQPNEDYPTIYQMSTCVMDISKKELQFKNSFISL